MDETRSFVEEARALLAAATADREAISALHNEVKALRERCRNVRAAEREVHRSAYVAAAEVIRQPYAETWSIKAEDLPPFPKPFTANDAGDNACLLTHANASLADWETFGKALTDFGFSLHTTNVEGWGYYAFYRNGRLVVTLSYSEHDRVLRAVVEPAEGNAPVPTGEICEGVPNSAEPCFVAIGDGLYDRVNCGMGYAYRLSDGSFVIIDGGMGYPEIIGPLSEKLKKLAGSDRVVVAAWFFTHIHADHVGAAFSMGERCSDWLTVKRFVYAFPSYARCMEARDPNVYDIKKIAHRCLDNFKGVEYITARTGQIFRFPGLVLEIIFSFDDCPMPTSMFAINDSSLVFRVKTHGEVHLFLGDVCEPTGPHLVAKHGDGLKSDVVQIAHHGIGGAERDVYERVKAELAFWPCAKSCVVGGRVEALYDSPEWRALTLVKTEPWLKDHYAQCNGTQVFALPLLARRELEI